MATPPTNRADYEALFPSFVESFPDGNYGPSGPIRLPVQPFGTPQPKPANEPSVPNPPQNNESIATRGAPPPRYKTMSQIKSMLLNPALTSHYQCWFNPPNLVRNYVASKGFDYNQAENSELISLSCTEASLPGSSLATNELTDDHTGVTERHSYRRLFDNTADFTFYVDHARKEGSYNLIWFFECWMAFIAGDGDFGPATLGSPVKEFSYRNRYPRDYQSQSLYIQKFEKDIAGSYRTIASQQDQRKTYLQYQFLNAYPTSINSMPVSYESSQLLKVTVTFTYSRYILSRQQRTPDLVESLESRGVDVQQLIDIQRDREDEVSRRELPLATGIPQPPSGTPLATNVSQSRTAVSNVADEIRLSSRNRGNFEGDQGRRIRGLE